MNKSSALAYESHIAREIGLHLFVRIVQRHAPMNIRAPERGRVYNYVGKYSFTPEQGDNCTGEESFLPLVSDCRNYASSRSNLSARTRPPLLPRASCSSCMSKSLAIILPVPYESHTSRTTRIDTPGMQFHRISQIRRNFRRRRESTELTFDTKHI